MLCLPLMYILPFLIAHHLSYHTLEAFRARDRQMHQGYETGRYEFGYDDVSSSYIIILQLLKANVSRKHVCSLL